ncbi:hypothetical protein M2326_000398 [Flavobacterium sp. 7A]|nr:hypothetical protein [Flavobacterium sp. 7A]
MIILLFKYDETISQTNLIYLTLILVVKLFFIKLIYKSTEII